MNDDVLHATLFQRNLAGTRVNISVSSSPGHDLRVSGSDFGAAPRAFFHASEYEYYLTIRAKDKEELRRALLAEMKNYDAGGEGQDDAKLLQLLVARFGGRETAYSELKDWCQKKAIPAEPSFWYSPDD